MPEIDTMAIATTPVLPLGALTRWSDARKLCWMDEDGAIVDHIRTGITGCTKDEMSHIDKVPGIGDNILSSLASVEDGWHTLAVCEWPRADDGGGRPLIRSDELTTLAGENQPASGVKHHMVRISGHNKAEFAPRRTLGQIKRDKSQQFLYSRWPHEVNVLGPQLILPSRV